MRIIKGFNCLFVLSFGFYSSFSSAQELITLEGLKQQLEVLQKQIIQLEKQQSASVESLAKVKKQKTNKIENKPTQALNESNTLKIYGTVRPTFGYIDENDQSQADVRDALSHAGFKATSEFGKGWSTTLHGEWGIDLSNNGDFGKARQVYVALNTPAGSVGIGKQRPVQYLFIAEYVDIFDHASSPFAYDAESIFFVDNLVTYKYKNDGFTWMAAAQFNGDTGENYSDLVNVGLSYDDKGLHAAATYLNQDVNINGNTVGDDETYAGALAYDFDNGLYLALGYQNKEYQRINDEADRSGHSVDISAAYWLAKEYRLKLGYFDFSDGINDGLSRDFDGFNTTLEWVPKPWLRFHLEYLQRDFDYLADFSSVSVGFRYDFSKQWQY
jgi:hypothetical protein